MRHGFDDKSRRVHVCRSCDVVIPRDSDREIREATRRAAEEKARERRAARAERADAKHAHRLAIALGQELLAQAERSFASTRVLRRDLYSARQGKAEAERDRRIALTIGGVLRRQAERTIPSDVRPRITELASYRSPFVSPRVRRAVGPMRPLPSSTRRIEA